MTAPGWALTIVLDPHSPVPPFEQIRAQVVALIVSSYLRPGAQLSSVRQLARDLQIAPNTVVRAYEELERDGWILAEARRGFVVATVPADIAEHERRARLRAAVAALLREARQFGWDAAAVVAEIERQGRAAASEHGGSEAQTSHA